MLPLERWAQVDDSTIKSEYKSIVATIKKSEDKWLSTLTTNIGPVIFSTNNTANNQEDAKNWCNANIILAYGIKEPDTDKAFQEYQQAMVQYNADLINFNKNIEIYTGKMNVWIQQNKEWLSSKYPAPVRPGPQPTRPVTPAVDPGPMPVMPSSPIRPVDPRDMSPVRPPVRPRPRRTI